MKTKFRSLQSRQGFTLVEIMIVVAIIAILATIAVPSFMRARKRTQATHILQELRMIDQAINLYFQENPGGPGGWMAYRPYVKENSRLYNAFSATGGVGGVAAITDPFGRYYHAIADTAGNPSVSVNPLTYADLQDVAPYRFWVPYIAADLE
jgi:prepilin-type N-terminal cleavage/methylation domain-containing protein